MRPGKKILVALAGVFCLVLVGGVGWLERKPLRSWYYLRGLDRADEGNCAAWVDRVTGLNQEVVPALLDRLGRDDPRVGHNALAALTRLVQSWSPEDSQVLEFARTLAEGFTRFRLAGKKRALQLAATWLTAESGPPPNQEVTRTLARLLPGASAVDEVELRGRTLDLACQLMARSDSLEFVGPCRSLAQASLADADPQNRALAVQLAMHKGMDLNKQLVPLLRDPEAEVRRLAMLVLGPAPEAIVTEELLHWLHDPDKEVRQLCEQALRERHLSPSHIRLGRLLTDPRLSYRLQVLNHLLWAKDLDPGVWLRHLSHDPKPSVRVAAIRAATEYFPKVTFSDRLEQMRADASPTVGQLAQYYLSLKKVQEEKAGAVNR